MCFDVLTDVFKVSKQLCHGFPLAFGKRIIIKSILRLACGQLASANVNDLRSDELLQQDEQMLPMMSVVPRCSLMDDRYYRGQSSRKRKLYCMKVRSLQGRGQYSSKANGKQKAKHRNNGRRAGAGS